MKMDNNWNIESGWIEEKQANESEDGNVEIPDHIYKKYQEKNYQTIEKIKQVGLPKNGEQLRIITMKSFNTISFIALIAEKEIIQELILVIFAINMKAAKLIIDLKKGGRIINLTLIVSSIRNAGHKLKSNAVKMFKENGMHMTFVNSHAKISAIKTKENSYVIEGSGNFSYNGRIEQYIIDNDPNLFDFTKRWINEMKLLMKNHDDFVDI